MERSSSQRENVLLGYIPNGNRSGSSARGSSDVNFSDVFGGPPRRSSMYEVRQRYAADVGDEEEETAAPYRGSLSGVREKPVFGEDGANRRRNNNDFFGDIFGGYESSGSNSKKQQDPFSSAPGSRVLSPAWPLKPDPSGVSAPPQFSLPAKVMNLPTFGSPTRSSLRGKDQASDAVSHSYSGSAFLPRFSEDTKNYSYSFYGHSSLSREGSLDSEELSGMSKSEKTGKAGHLENASEVSGDNDNSQFHFSIYKWASKGVPLMMPRRAMSSSRLKEMGRTGMASSSKLSVSRSSSKGSLSSENETLRDIDKPSLGGIRKAIGKSFGMMDDKNNENDSLLSTGTHSRAESSQMVVEEVAPLPESTAESRVKSTVKDVSFHTVLDTRREKTKHESRAEVGLGGKAEKEAPNPVVMQRALKSAARLKPLRSLFNDEGNEQDNGEVTVKAGESKGVNKSNKIASVEKVQASGKVEKQEEKQNAIADAVVDKASVKGSSRKSGSNLGRNKVKGKVKEFVKIFNQEESSKSRTAVESQNGTSRAEKEASLGTAAMDQKFQVHLNKETILDDASTTKLNKVEERHKQSEKHYSATKTEKFVPSSTSSKPKNATASSAASAPDVPKTVVGDTVESSRRDFVMKELPLEKNEKPEPGKDQEDMKAIDANIRKWSNGKEGNIRSLLSTLQYVLWPESGWKPVPLVDIIEGNAVKRTYQRALLRLHPDKLQQKGAASHHKYIAEKVFDILQEAWTQFNSLGSL